MNIRTYADDSGDRFAVVTLTDPRAPGDVADVAAQALNSESGRPVTAEHVTTLDMGGLIEHRFKAIPAPASVTTSHASTGRTPDEKWECPGHASDGCEFGYCKTPELPARYHYIARNQWQLERVLDINICDACMHYLAPYTGSSRIFNHRVSLIDSQGVAA